VAVTGNALSPTVDRRIRQTSRDVDEAERSRHLASVSAGQPIDNVDWATGWAVSILLPVKT